jgi:hypothetical protein
MRTRICYIYNILEGFLFLVAVVVGFSSILVYDMIFDHPRWVIGVNAPVTRSFICT